MPRPAFLRSCAALGLLALAIASLFACASAPPAANTAAAPSAEPPRLEERALLLLMEDRCTVDAEVIDHLAGGDAEQRELAAAALGRIGDAAMRPTLEVLLLDSAPAVRRAAAFALGELGEKASQGALLRAVADGDEETGSLAVEALSKLGAEAQLVDRALIVLGEEQRSRRLLPYLFRFKGAGVVDLASEGLLSLDRTVHAQAAYALAREPQAAGAPQLRLLLADADPFVRDWAARGLGAVGENGDLVRLRPLLDDPAAGVVIQALRASGKLLGAGKTAAPADWKPRLLELFDDARPGVAVTAIEASAAWLLDEALGAVLAERAASADAPARQREVALLALAQARDSRAPALTERAAHAASPAMRACAAEAAGHLGDRAVLERLQGDDSATVRVAALDARLRAKIAGDADAGKLARRALADRDPIVRATALDALGAELSLAELAEALARSAGDDANDAPLAIVRALAARAAKAAPAERQSAVEQLQRVAAAHADFLVRRLAAGSLVGLGEPRPAIGAASDRDLTYYRDVLRQVVGEHEVVLVTARGPLRIRLFCTEAPLTCLNFLQLARQGFFDGTVFHRVVPDFVAQGGDPRGDGSGGPGYSIRDEINRHRYTRGAVGMALSGPDTGGSQFFITLMPQPHLDGGFTIFGEVVEGMDVADRLEQGDRIETATVQGPR